MTSLTHDKNGLPIKPRKKRAAPERLAQRSVVQWLRMVLPSGSIVAAVTNEDAARSLDPLARARYGVARKAVGVLSGFPDLAVLVPPGQTILLEMKSPQTGRLSEAQIEMHARLAAAGFVVGVATDIDTARLVMRRAGVALREAML